MCVLVCPSTAWPGLVTALGMSCGAVGVPRVVTALFAGCLCVWQRAGQPRSAPIDLFLIPHCSFPEERAPVPSVQRPVVKCQWCYVVFESLLLLEGLFSLHTAPASSSPLRRRRRRRKAGGRGPGAGSCVIWQDPAEPTVENPFARVQ